MRVIFSANSNMYKVDAESMIAVYGDFIEGTGDEITCLISANPLSDAALNALAKSLAALGYGMRGSARVVLHTADGASLGPADLMSIMEGLDPVIGVATDEESAALLGQAYRCPVELDASNRVMGRTIVAFQSFEQMLDSPEHKQRAWALLKKIPRLG